MPGLADASPRLICRCSQTFKASHENSGKGPFGSGDQADAGRVERGVQRREDLRIPIEAYPSVVDQPGAQNLQEVEAAKLYSCRNDSLVSRQLRALPRVQRKRLVSIAEDISSAETEAVAEMMINLYQEVVAVDVVWKAVRQVGFRTGNVFLRIQTQECGAQRVLGPARSCVCGSGRCNVSGAWHTYRQRRTRSASLAFKPGEEESAIVHDRTPDSCTV